MNRKARRLSKKQDDFAALCELGITRNRQGRLLEAIHCYQQAVALRPDEPLARNNLGLLLKSARRLAEAADHFRYVLARRPELAEVHNNLGTTLEAQGQIDEAIACYHRAIAINSDFYAARISLAVCLCEQGRIAEALDQAEIVSFFTNEPSFPHFQFGALLARCNCVDAAKTCLERYLTQDPADRAGARLILAKLGLGPLPERASIAQLDHIYARRALSWDAGSTGSAGYGGAELVARTLEQLIERTEGLDILDAGCGTGLVGLRLRGRARRLEGVDMSAPMLEQAKAKGVYDRLHQGDLVAFLRKREQAFDAVTCAATLIHFGDLREAFEAAALSLRDSGLLVLTLFPNDTDNDAVAVAPLDGLGEGGCFLHGRRYVARMAEASGLAVAAMETHVHEHTRGHARMGLVVALRREPRASIVPSQSAGHAIDDQPAAQPAQQLR
jgi:predicted TPR repeat methyltransferase